jgi:hypothetical protein
MNVLKAVAQELQCFVLGVDHFGKDLQAGTRGAYSKESSGDLVLACLGMKELSGSVSNTRLAVRKNRGGQQGQEFPFVLKKIEAREPDEDGEPVTTMVVDWQPADSAGAHAQPDPWAKPKRQDQRTAVLRLKRVLMAILADQGVDLQRVRTGRWCGWSIRSWSESGSTPARLRRALLHRKVSSGASGSIGRSTGLRISS